MEKQAQRRMVNGLKWDNATVVRQINLMVPLDGHLFYTCKRLHEIPHGDEKIQDKPNFDAILTSAGVDVVNVEASTQVGPLRVYHSSSKLMMYMNIQIKDIDSFQRHLFDHLYGIYNEGGASGSRDSNAGRIDFGLGQVQSTSKSYIDCRGVSHRLPFCNLNAYHAMDEGFQTGLRALLMFFDQEINTKKGGHSSCNDDLRTGIVSDLFLEAGWDGPSVRWEYINISIRSVDDDLWKHFDGKNDRRRGYDHVAVYSFPRSYSNKSYRVVIVMTFRTAMGSVMDDLHTASA